MSDLSESLIHMLQVLGWRRWHSVWLSRAVTDSRLPFWLGIEALELLHSVSRRLGEKIFLLLLASLESQKSHFVPRNHSVIYVRFLLVHVPQEDLRDEGVFLGAY